MLTTTPHLKHPRELLVGLLLRSRGVHLPLILPDGQEAQALGDGLQVGAVVHHGPIGLHHDLRAREWHQRRGAGSQNSGARFAATATGLAGQGFKRGELDLLEVGRDGGEGEDLKAEDVEAVVRVVLHLVVLHLPFAAASGALPDHEPAFHHRVAFAAAASAPAWTCAAESSSTMHERMRVSVKGGPAFPITNTEWTTTGILAGTTSQLRLISAGSALCRRPESTTQYESADRGCFATFVDIEAFRIGFNIKLVNALK
jgi:hypothetical protein